MRLQVIAPAGPRLRRLRLQPRSIRIGPAKSRTAARQVGTSANTATGRSANWHAHIKRPEKAAKMRPRRRAGRIDCQSIESTQKALPDSCGGPDAATPSRCDAMDLAARFTTHQARQELFSARRRIKHSSSTTPNACTIRVEGQPAATPIAPRPGSCCTVRPRYKCRRRHAT